MRASSPVVNDLPPAGPTSSDVPVRQASTPASGGPIGVTRFTTDAFAAADRHEAWANRGWPAIGPVFETVPIGAFHNRSERFALGEVAIHRSDMAAQRYHRPATLARRDGFDGLMAEILLSGETRGDAAGRSTHNVAGRTVFNDLAQGHSHVSSETQTLLVSIPRALAKRNNIDPAVLHGRHMSAGSTDLLKSHLLAVHGLLPHVTVAQGERLGQIVLDLIGVALDVDGLRAPAAASEARDTVKLLEAQRLIDTHLHSPALTVDWLCGRLCVSRSRLYRLFKDEGGIRSYIRDRRLERIQAILLAPGSCDLLADLAENWGFSDAAHLSRSFRARFGMAPSDFRALHAGG
jgi:AraC-like DNA-binding protein